MIMYRIIITKACFSVWSVNHFIGKLQQKKQLKKSQD